MCVFFFFQAEDGIRDAQESRGLGDVYKRQILMAIIIVMRDRAAKQHRIDAEMILINSNQWQQAEAKLRDEKNVNAQLGEDLKAQRTAVADLSNSLSQISGKLTETAATLTSAQGAVQQKIVEIAKRDEQIAELEKQNRTLDEHAAELTSAINMLTSQIGDTEQKLATHSGDKAFLVKELKRLLTEKAELERQFNDVKALRSQLAKVKEGVNVSRRLQWRTKGFVIFHRAKRRLTVDAGRQPRQRFRANNKLRFECRGQIGRVESDSACVASIMVGTIRGDRKATGRTFGCTKSDFLFPRLRRPLKVFELVEICPLQLQRFVQRPPRPTGRQILPPKSSQSSDRSSCGVRNTLALSIATQSILLPCVASTLAFTRCAAILRCTRGAKPAPTISGKRSSRRASVDRGICHSAEL